MLLALAAVVLAAAAALLSPPVARVWRAGGGREDSSRATVPAAREAAAERDARPARSPADAAAPAGAPAAKRGGAEQPADPGGGGAERLRAEAEYQLLQAELKLAATLKPYAVLLWDPQPRLEVRLKGATVGILPLRVEGGEEAVRRFRDRFRGSQRRVLRAVGQKYLYTAQDQTPDSVLTIVGNVLNMEPEVLQRHLPEWFELKFRDDLVLEARADVKGEPMPGVDLKIVRLQQRLRRPFGEVRLSVRMDARDALTLYRLAGPGFPVLSPLF